MSERTKLEESVLVRALMEFSGRSRGQVEEFMAGKTAPELLSFRDSLKVRPIYERLMLEMTAEG